MKAIPVIVIAECLGLASCVVDSGAGPEYYQTVHWMGFGINDSGDIVGASTVANGGSGYLPFVYRNGIMTQLGITSNALAEALAISCYQ
jgi:probable HAF family extracellular repeat protein